MRGVSERLLQLPGFKPLGASTGAPPVFVPQRAYAEWLQTNNGAVALGGALRLFPSETTRGLADIARWNSHDNWKRHYGSLAPDSLVIFGEDAFGVQFGFLEDGTIRRFWNETGEQEDLSMDLAMFFEVIADDPAGTVSYDLYADAVEQLGALGLDSHFAFKIETALGGKLTIENRNHLLVLHCCVWMRTRLVPWR